MHHRPCVRSVSFSLRCLLVLGWIPLGTPALASDHPARIFTNPVYLKNSTSVSMAAADFNGDQAIDLATVGYPGISVLLARGDGGFEEERTILTGG